MHNPEPWRQIRRGLRFDSDGLIVDHRNANPVGAWEARGDALTVTFEGKSFLFLGALARDQKKTCLQGTTSGEGVLRAFGGSVDVRLRREPIAPAVTVEAADVIVGTWDLLGQNDRRPARRIRFNADGTIVGADARRGQLSLCRWSLAHGALTLFSETGAEVAVMDQQRTDRELGWVELAGCEELGWLVLSRGNCFSGRDDLLDQWRFHFSDDDRIAFSFGGGQVPAYLSADGCVRFESTKGTTPLCWTLRHGGLVLYSPTGAQSWSAGDMKDALPLPLQFSRASLGSENGTPSVQILASGTRDAPGVAQHYECVLYPLPKVERKAPASRRTPSQRSQIKNAILDGTDLYSRFRRRRLFIDYSRVDCIDAEGSVWRAESNAPNAGPIEMKRVSSVAENGRAIGLGRNGCVFEDGGVAQFKEGVTTFVVADIEQGPLTSSGICLRRDGTVGCLDILQPTIDTWSAIPNLQDVVLLTHNGVNSVFATTRRGQCFTVGTTARPASTPANTLFVVSANHSLPRVWLSRDGTVSVQQTPIRVSYDQPLTGVVDMVSDSSGIVLLDNQRRVWVFGWVEGRLYKMARQLLVPPIEAIGSGLLLDDRGWLRRINRMQQPIRPPFARGAPYSLDPNWLPPTDETDIERIMRERKAREGRRYVPN